MPTLRESILADFEAIELPPGYALEWDGAQGADPADWLRTKANSIEGGTSEVMLSIISRRVLGLGA